MSKEATEKQPARRATQRATSARKKSTRQASRKPEAAVPASASPGALSRAIPAADTLAAGITPTGSAQRRPVAREATPAVQHPDRLMPQPDAWRYLTDVWQRSVLFLDTLRRRANDMLAHERAGLPPLLDFKYETILDARHFARPANYALLRITEIGGQCWDACVRPDRPPLIVVDPRAGHGPGIGGFKRASEVGMALHEGFPVYFVVFFPEPMPGQTLADVHHALRRFVEEVAHRHDNKAPVLYGNCQAGWAVTLLAADCEGLAGPVVLNGSPLSYWAGESGVNPMRVSGGLLGGAWLAYLVADLGNGRFDGAWLAQNFENLKPEKAIWEKYAGLFNRIDGEAERFLDFERWWGGFYALGRDEIVAIVEDLFIGNKLEQGKVRICAGCYVDLRRIRHPLVVFASYGDNITPPHQALGWIPAVYQDTDDLRQAGQRIVYLTNPRVGHLGIFVSSDVARLEHRAILGSLDAIEALAPGLYEMKIDPLDDDPQCHEPRYRVRFEARRVEDLRFPHQSDAFERAGALSELNASLYRDLFSPWVRMLANPWSAEWLKWMHPMRVSRHLFSESFNPWMHGIAPLAATVAAHREPLPADDPWLADERAWIGKVSEAIEHMRTTRDDLAELTFSLLYGAASDAGAPQ